MKKRRDDWMSELLFEQTTMKGISSPSEEIRSSYSDPGFSQTELVSGFTGMKIPKSVDEYKALLAKTFDPKKRELAFVILEQPALRMALSMWDARHPQKNRNLAAEIVRFVSTLMGKVYGFVPAGVIFKELPPGLRGQQDSYANRVYLSPNLLMLSSRDFLDTVVHEQIHRLQAEMMGRLVLSKGGKPLTLDERALAMYWKAEEPKYRSVLSAGWDMKGDTLKRYRELGQEYHAYDSGLFVSGQVCSYDPPRE